MRHCVIGYKGEVGSAVYEFLKERGQKTVGVDIKDRLPDYAEYIHVCIPYSDKFVNIIKKYAKSIDHKYIIIYSSVPVGTTEKISKNAVHSPVEGRHPELFKSFKTFKRLVGGSRSQEIAKFFEDNGIHTEWFKSSKSTELGKLLSTTRYGLNLMFADMEAQICKKLKVNFHDSIIAYQRMYNNGYLALGEARFVQQILTPPSGKIGGHCVVPNAKLLFKDTRNPIIGRIAKYG
jgi:UDP-N-acetyl-D-mannosaminuronate dehydrogenase